MKKIFNIILLWLSLLITQNSMANTITINNKNVHHQQEKSQDTMRYLRENIVNRKGRFIHQELNVVLKELHISVKSYLIHFVFKPQGNLDCIMLFFDDHKTTTMKLQSHKVDVPAINIYFDQDVTNTQARAMHAEGDGKWRDAEQQFYGKLTVKDIVGMQPTHKK